METKKEMYNLLLKAMKHGEWRVYDVGMFKSATLSCYFDGKLIKLTYSAFGKGVTKVKKITISKDVNSVSFETNELKFTFLSFFTSIKLDFFATKKVNNFIKLKSDAKEKEREISFKKIFKK